MRSSDVKCRIRKTKKMKNYLYGELRYLVLQKVSEAPFTLDDIIDWLLTPGSGSKGGWTNDDRWEFKQRRHQRLLEEERKKERQKTYVLLHRLQESGLVTKQKIAANGKSKWFITEKGLTEKNFATRLIDKFVNKIKINVSTSYSDAKLSKQKIIIIFDIEEKERWKRSWIRAVLKNLNFEMLQKSVWLGKTILPKEFAEDLKKLNLLKAVKIFSVSNEGSINF